MENGFWNLDESVTTAIRMAKSVARENLHATYTPVHLLKGLMHKEVGVIEYLKSQNKDLSYIGEWADVRLEEMPRSGQALEVKPSPEIAKVFEEADKIRARIGWTEITPLCVLAAIAKPGIAYSIVQLKSFPIKENEITDNLVGNLDVMNSINPSIENEASGTRRNTSADAPLYKYCIDRTSEIFKTEMHAIICRENEMRMMIEILGRKSKPNVIITGDSGVGKTALIEGLAWDIVEKRVPSFLYDATIFELDFGALIAGASYKGEVEDRLKNIIRDLRSMDKTILFIDELHTLLDTKQGNNGIASILKPELAKGDLTVIGATTTDEYRKVLEPDHAFSRCFEELKVTEPDEVSAIRMVNANLSLFADFHQLGVSKEAVVESVRLAKRYVKDRRLPDSAIDLLDRTLSAVKLINETAKQDIVYLTSLLELIEFENIEAPDAKLIVLKDVYKTMQQMLSPILLGMINDETNPDTLDDPNILADFLNNKLVVLSAFIENPISEVTPQEIAAIVSNKTGIPLGKLQLEEKERLLKMEDILRQRVVGQDHALKSLVDAILESRSGLNKPGQPIGSFFFLGPTGTGKTELAKALAEALFNDEKAMIRFDMSEFKEEHSAALLYGAPPGYVGYEEGGLLVNKIRQNPYSVVLFDEIEKAHASVYDIFLQIMDEGKLHDRLGKEGDFSNAIVLFTSNVGSEWLAKQLSEGTTPTTTQLMEVMGRHFRPEFLARLSEIVPFSPISEDILLKIFDIQFKNVIKLLDKQSIAIRLTDEVKFVLAHKGFDPKYGARQISGMIRTYLRRPISRLIIEGRLSSGHNLTVGLDDKNELTWNID